MRTTVNYQPTITAEHKELCEKYWLRKKEDKISYVHTCQSLSKEYGLRLSEVTTIVKDNACLKVLDCLCLECGTVSECKTRSALINLDINNWCCDTCWHAYQERQQQEWHDYLLEQNRLQQEHRKSMIKFLDDYRKKQESAIPPMKSLSLSDKLLLVAAIEALGSDNLKTTLALTDALNKPLSPLRAMDLELIKYLFKANILLLNPINNLAYENITESGEADLNLDYAQVVFDFAYDINQITSLRIEVKEQKTAHELIGNIEFKDWCKKIQLAECIAYLTHRARINGLTAPVGESMASFLQANLTIYSVAELSRLIWMAVESASAYSNKPNITNKHASNSIYTILRNNIDKVSNGTWKCKTFNRDTNLPKSIIAKVFFDDVFKVHDGSFNYIFDELIVNMKTNHLSTN